MGLLGAFLSEQQYSVMVRKDTDVTDEKSWTGGNIENVQPAKSVHYHVFDVVGINDLQCRWSSFWFLHMKSISS